MQKNNSCMRRCTNIAISYVPGIIAVILIISTSVAVLTSDRNRMIALTREDGIVEYSAVLFYLASAGLMLILFGKSASFRRAYLFGTRRNISFLVIGVLFLIFAGEEISWGQRILNYESPDFWLQANRQGETTLHNLNFWEALDTEGNQKYGIVRFFSSAALYSYFWLTLCLILPVLDKVWLKANQFLKEAGVPVINIFYGVLFTLNYVVFEMLERAPIEPRPVGEIKETNSALLFLAVSIYITVKYGQSTAIHAIHFGTPNQS